MFDFLEQVFEFIVVTFLILFSICLLSYGIFTGYQHYAVRNVPLSYKDTVISKMIEEYHPEETTVTYININNINVPFPDTTPAYTDYKIAFNTFKDSMKMDKETWSQFHQGEKVRVGYKIAPGGDTFFYTLKDKNDNIPHQDKG